MHRHNWISWMWLAMATIAATVAFGQSPQEQTEREVARRFPGPLDTPPPAHLPPVDPPEMAVPVWGYSGEQLNVPYPMAPAAASAGNRCMNPYCSVHGCATDSKAVARLLDPKSGYRPPSAFRPLGDAVYSTFSIQVANGLAARMALYRYDFVAGRGDMNPRGRRQLQKIARYLPQTPYFLFIEPAENPELDVARRSAVLAELSSSPFPVPEERVVTSIPPALGLDGVDAVPIHQRLLELSGSYTPQPTASANGDGAQPSAPPLQ